MTDETAEKVKDLTGWKPPVIYDLQTDTHRIATQEDIDRLQTIERLYGEVVFQTRRLLDEQKARLANRAAEPTGFE
jgi:hypothetical protein